MIIDPISDLVVKVKNASKAHHADAVIQTSSLTSAILTVLKNEGYITDFEVKNHRHSDKKQRTIVKLKYKDQTPVITGIKQISKPGLRIYQENKKLPKVLNGLGIAIISTSQGVVTDKFARKNNLGGEVIAYVW